MNQRGLSPSRARRSIDLVVASGSISFAFVAIALLRSWSSVAGVVIVIAVAWGAAPFAIDVLTTVNARPGGRNRRRGSFTTIVRLGDEPPDIALTSIILAMAAGPTVVVSTHWCPWFDEVRALGVPLFLGTTIEAVVYEAARRIDTDATFVVSAGAFPLTIPCRDAAGELGEEVGWVVGTAPSFNNDRYGPYYCELLGGSRRAHARAAGLDLWEPDATLVRTDLLRALPMNEGRPWGSWLRSRAAQGYRGVTVDTPLALRAAPADADPFWAIESIRQRAAVADCTDAARHGSPTTRVLAVGGLLRGLYAYAAIVWLVAPLLVGWSGTFPFRCSPLVFVILQVTLAGARWALTRVESGVGLHPVQDLQAHVYDAPGSLRALPSAITGRVRAPRVPLPHQPLLWATVLLTVVTTTYLIDRAPSTSSAIDAAVGLALINLAGMWVFALHAIGTRAWDRTTYRLALDLPASVEGRPARTVDVSPSGLAVTGLFRDLAVGSVVSVTIWLAGHRRVDLHAVVVDRRAAGRDVVLGLSLQLELEERAHWIRELFVEAAPARRCQGAPRPRESQHVPAIDQSWTRQRVLHRLEAVVVGTVAFLVVGVLVLVFFGFRPLVVRSASMTPALAVGDVALVQWVLPTDVLPGDIVTFHDPDHSGETVTHRVRQVKIDAGFASFETRGDANQVSEFWSVPETELVGKVAGKIPRLGSIVAPLGTEHVRLVLLISSAALVLIGIGTAFRGRRAQNLPVLPEHLAGDRLVHH